MYIFIAASHLKTAKKISLILIFIYLLIYGAIDAIGAADVSQHSRLDAFCKELADELVNNSSISEINQKKILIVNLVDMSQLHCTSKFGQLIPEKLRGLLQKRGLRVVEARRGLTLKFQKNTGQFILTDEVSDLAAKVNCSAVLAGTYLFHGGKILVNLKLIAVPQNELISSATKEFTPDNFTTSLLQPIGFGCKTSKAFIKIKPFVSEKKDDFSITHEK